MNRFLVEARAFEGDLVTVRDPDDVHHLSRVLRVREGERLSLTDGEGLRVEATVSVIERGRIVFRIALREPRVRREDQRVRLSLMCAVPKFAHFEEVVDKGTQLGVDEIVPLFTERTLVDRVAFEKKRGRYERLRLAAGKQSGALFVPVLSGSSTFPEIVSRLKDFDRVLIPNLSEASIPLQESLVGFSGGRLAVLIGPEGDFSEREVQEARMAGAQGVDLGSSVLRVDTAAIAVMSYVRLTYGP